MKIELMDFKNPLKTYDVDFSRVTNMAEGGDGSTVVTVFNKGDIQPTVISVRESIKDINELAHKGYVRRLEREQ